MENLVDPTLAFIAAHVNWAVAVMFVISFGESFALVGIAFPGTSLLLAAGALVGAGTLPALPIIAGAILGAVAGDGISYSLGRLFGDEIGRIWPFNRNPHLIANGKRFFARHGGKSVFIGRFLGPMRGTVPLAAGLMRMPADRYWFANIVSALVWAPLLLTLGMAMGRAGERFLGSKSAVLVLILAIVVVGIAGLVWAVLRGRRKES
jgi:membrane protein DedA with SNARE-associated domain